MLLGAPSSGEALDAWLERLADTLPVQIADCREEEARLAGLWQHMVPKLSQFLPDEVTHVVQMQLDAAARRGAAEALAGLVDNERSRLAGTSAGVDDHTLLRLLDSITSDRISTGRALTAEVLETLCSIALDLELTERRVGDRNDSITATLGDLRSHVIAAAEALRRLPSSVAVAADSNDQLSVAVSRCLSRYGATLDTHLEWRGGEPSQPESAAALVWVLQELLHHLHGCTAGTAAVRVDVGTTLVANVDTPSPAFARNGSEPDWLLRSRLRLELAGGAIVTTSDSSGSRVEFELP